VVKEKEVDGTLKFADLVFRAWYYFRIGYTQYLSFFVGFLTFVAVLWTERLPFLQKLFPNFYLFIMLGISAIVPLSLLIGWFHMKRTPAYPTEAAIGVESNPYNYVIAPGKETEAIVPAWMLTVQALQKILEKENMMSAEEKREFETIVANFKKLLRGEVVGVPRQRQVLAMLKREEESMKRSKVKP